MLQNICNEPPRGATATAKTASLTLRIDPALKETRRTSARREQRCIANMIEIMIRDFRR